MRRDLKQIEAAFSKREPLLKTVARTLEAELTGMLAHLPHIDRVYFGAKGVASFVEKAQSTGDNGKPKYAHPLEEIEDQIRGRVLVFYRSDIAEVLRALEGKWRKAEQEHRRPASTSQFDYETTHRICVITPDMCPPEWAGLDALPSTFELQIRTLAQHAWSEPQHDFYKNRGGLTELRERKLYWAAASAWGMDSIWEELQQELAGLHEPH
jgi:ppGpp synthetase/RelA/SpoT-type nucleotidyltranferase